MPTEALRTGPTHQRSPNRRAAEIDALPKYITQQESPGNVQRIKTAEVQLPAEILRRRLCRARLRARIIKGTNEFIVRNAENLRWAILRGLDETFRKAVAHFEAHLDDAISTIKHVSWPLSLR